MRTFAVACALLLLVGCPSGRAAATKPPAQLAADCLAWHGAAAAVTASMLVKTKAPDGDSATFSLHLWAASDGRTRLRLAKLGFDGMDALVKPDGEFDLVLPRSNETFHGWLHEFLPEDARVDRADLALIVDELKRGPLAAVPAYEGHDRTLRYRDPVTGFTATVQLDASTPAVKTKTLARDDGKTMATIRYENYARIDELWRPMRIRIEFPRGGSCTLRYENGGFDAVPAISAEGMAVKVPAGARKLSFDEFLDKLGGGG